jgi:hypothetical protein
VKGGKIASWLTQAHEKRYIFIIQHPLTEGSKPAFGEPVYGLELRILLFGPLNQTAFRSDAQACFGGRKDGGWLVFIPKGK